MLAVNLINDGIPGNHTHSANQCADHLAHMGAEQEEDLIVVVDIPISLTEFLIRDGLNIRRILD
ncbi:hypothetical protein RHMOL_Rhmol10G0221400 [Rhododendron molle]|uniref:Uncharacterized protein n=1 Tax=Rhododendron molle TaxID=49168 RepID=A0ACC0M663_RHOML|nr:hypothetical protein RHMOL_Rhmol10G0221400 [Rhododendron molle]